jgi:putative intracellular protease/amidase
LWRTKQDVRISSTNQIIELETSKNNEAVLPPYTEHGFFVVFWRRVSVFMEVNIILFDDFDSLDAFGVADIFGRAAGHFHINYLSVGGNIVNSMQGVKVWTESLCTAQIRDIVVVPGGNGARRLLFQDVEAVEEIKRAVGKAQTCLMVGNGAAVLAQTGLLYRRKIADCKIDKNWRRLFMGGVAIVEDATWVADGKFYSSASSMTGIDMALGVVADLVDVDLAYYLAEQIGHTQWDADDERVFQ